MKIVLDKDAYMPERAHQLDAGYDIRTPYDVIIPARGNAVIQTGVHVQIPAGYVGFLKSKSGLNVKYNLVGEGVIDAGYTGSIMVKLYNSSDVAIPLFRGDKIIQLVLLPIYTPEIEKVDSLDETERGDNGFGSTGR